MSIIVIEAPTEEPVSLDELKAFARVDHDDDDALLTSLGIAAREFVETTTGRALMTQTLEMVTPTFPLDTLRLPRFPVQSIESFTYLDRSGDQETLVENTDYFVDTDTVPPMLQSARYWPAVADRSNSVRVRFVAGYDSADKVPQTIKTVICALAAHWYESREPVVIGAAVNEVPFHVKRILSTTRNWGHV